MSKTPLLIALLVLSACVDPPVTDKTGETGETGAPSEGEGEGEDNCPVISLDSLVVSVTGAAVNADNTAVLTITNDCSGEFPLVLSPSLAASSSATFSVPTDRLTVPPATSQELVITFNPPDFETYAATVVLDSNDVHNPSIEVPVWGQAVADADEDGFDSPEAGGSDCDDADPEAYPGATEVWYDGQDGDCLGDSDYDQDGDGYDYDAYGGDDCDDEDEDVYPGGDDAWYDGVDGDCAGNSDYDKDGDGQDAESYRGPDCDDTDPDIYFGADDTPYDGEDTDCDGTSDYDADKDGYDSPDYGGDDCDDEDPDSYPDASDTYDGNDTDCDGLLDEDGISVGNILITEVMTDPYYGTENKGEWFEIYNDSSLDIDLYGWVVSQDDGLETFTIDEHLEIGPGEFKIFICSSDTTKNGGITPDFVYARADFELEDRHDTIVFSVEGREIIGIEYRSSWGMTAGYATQLDPDRFDDSVIEEEDSWCAAESTYGMGDYGTPGDENDQC